LDILCFGDLGIMFIRNGAARKLESIEKDFGVGLAVVGWCYVE